MPVGPGGRSWRLLPGLPRGRTCLARPGGLGQSSLANIVMELKKVCNHPLLVAQEDAPESRSERLRVRARLKCGTCGVERRVLTHYFVTIALPANHSNWWRRLAR